MQVSIRPFGNSRGIVIPKPLLQQLGLQDQADLTVENGAIVIRKPIDSPRAGWVQAAQALAQAENDTLAMGEFGNEDDQELTW
jgi:antitoxin MazE